MMTTSPGILIWKRRVQGILNGYMHSLSRQFDMLNTMSVSSNRLEAPASNSPAKMKPPNILIYYPVKENLCKPKCLINIIEKCMERHRYVVYTLMHNKMLTDPWMENCKLLIVPHSTEINESIFNLLQNFVTDGGKILGFCRGLAEHFEIHTVPVDDDSTSCYNVFAGDKIIPYDIPEPQAFSIENSSNCEPILKCGTPTMDVRKVVAVKQHWPGDNCMIHCSIPILRYCEEEECLRPNNSAYEIIRFLLSTMDVQTGNPIETTDDVTPSYIYYSNSKLMLQFMKDMKISSLGKMVKGDSLTLEFCEVDASNSNSDSTIQSMNLIPVFYSTKVGDFKTSCKFDWNRYRQTLISKKFGKVVWYSDKVTSTMDVAEALISRLYDSTDFCIIIVARQQTKGKGRGGNKWLSPPGTAMMTVSFSLPLRSYLGERLPILQHIMTVAVVHSIRSIPAYKDLDLRVKWPNDIYFGSTIKIGGVLVRSTMFRSTCVATIGCGINVDNHQPTQCINRLICDMGVSLPLSCEEVLALAISELERIVQEFQQNGPKSFMSLYYKYWLHSKQKVKVQVADDYVDAEVIGIDEFGFLCVKDCQSGPNHKVITLQPDDNSFDMMKNMIAVKS